MVFGEFKIKSLIIVHLLYISLLSLVALLSDVEAETFILLSGCSRRILLSSWLEGREDLTKAIIDQVRQIAVIVASNSVLSNLCGVLIIITVHIPLQNTQKPLSDVDLFLWHPLHVLILTPSSKLLMLFLRIVLRMRIISGSQCFLHPAPAQQPTYHPLAQQTQTFSNFSHYRQNLKLVCQGYIRKRLVVCH